MPSPDHDDILNRVLDGQADPAEIEALEKALEGDPSARRYRDRLAALASAMRRMGTVEPPPDLRAKVMLTIRQPASPSPQRASWLEALRAGMHARLLAREVLVFAAGLAVGALVLVGVRGDWSALSGEGATGTMILGSAVEGSPPLQSLPFQTARFRGSLQTYSTTDGVLAEVEIQATEEALVVLGFDPAAFEPVAVRQFRPVHGGIEIRSDKILVHHQGQGRYQLFLHALGEKNSPLRVEITSQGDRFEDTLVTRPGGS